MHSEVDTVHVLSQISRSKSRIVLLPPIIHLVFILYTEAPICWWTYVRGESGDAVQSRDGSLQQLGRYTCRPTRQGPVYENGNDIDGESYRKSG